ncbi:MAG TPA: SDR family oxidoreductase [Gemmatimonadaceae bacterium]
MTATPRPVALITGASAGLGREFAAQLAREGYDLVLVARNADRLRALSTELRQLHGAEAEVLCADLTSDGDVSRVVARIDQAPPDLLVNNAGFGTRGSLARASRDDQEAMIRVHVLAAHRLTQAAVQGMVGRGGGAIINVSSVASWLTSPGNVNYTATKAWQRVFIESLSLELGAKGVYAQALCPGYTHTEFHRRGGMDKRRVPAWWWMSAERVVDESLRAVRRRRPVVVVPGGGYKLAVLVIRFLPRWLWRLILSARRGNRGSGAPGL